MSEMNTKVETRITVGKHEGGMYIVELLRKHTTAQFNLLKYHTVKINGMETGELCRRAIAGDVIEVVGKTNF